MFALCFRKTLYYVSKISLSYIFCLLRFLMDMFIKIKVKKKIKKKKVKLESSNDATSPPPPEIYNYKTGYSTKLGKMFHWR